MTILPMVATTCPMKWKSLCMTAIVVDNLFLFPSRRSLCFLNFFIHVYTYYSICLLPMWRKHVKLCTFLSSFHYSLYKVARILPLPFLAIFEIIFHHLFSLQVTQYTTLSFPLWKNRAYWIDSTPSHTFVKKAAWRLL